MKGYKPPEQHTAIAGTNCFKSGKSSLRPIQDELMHHNQIPATGQHLLFSKSCLVRFHVEPMIQQQTNTKTHNEQQRLNSSREKCVVSPAWTDGAGSPGGHQVLLYAKGRVLGFKRAKRNQRPDISLIQIEGVKTAADTDFYLGKRIAFVYRAKRE
ncbi:hypothetical protein BGX26_011331, partial [Mortierella sp. AD094]